MISLRRYAVSLMLVCSVIPGIMPAHANAAQPNASSFEPYVAISDYSWRETDFDGSRLMKESGFLYGLGLVYTHQFDSGLTLKPALELFSGNVDYDGATQAGVPVKSTTFYYGVKLRGDAGMKFGTSSSIEPFAGLALWYWSRTVDDSIAANGTPAFGYTEDWTAFFARLGVRGSVALPRSWGLFAEAGMKVPIYNKNYAHIGSGITLHPGERLAFFGEAGAGFRAFRLSATYDGQRYSQSDIAAGWYQPESTADQYGVKISYAF